VHQNSYLHNQGAPNYGHKGDPDEAALAAFGSGGMKFSNGDSTGSSPA